MTVLNISNLKFPCRSSQSDEIRCRTSAGNLTSDALVVLTIDAARVSNPGVFFSYRNNPNVTDVYPSNTIPSGGITLTFTGVDLDVVQQPVLEVYQSMGAPLVSQKLLIYIITYSPLYRGAPAVLWTMPLLNAWLLI